MKFKVEIDTSSAAFGGEDEDELTAQFEVARMLEDLASRIRINGYEIDEPIVLRDYNGNRVGHAAMVTP